MRVSFHPDYFVELPPGHPFPMAKFPELHRHLLDEQLIGLGDVIRPKPASLDLLRLVHTEEYLWKLATGNLTAAEERRLGIPWTEPLWRRSRLAVSGTLNAARMALADGHAGNLAGGTHHAFPDHGQGYCVLNDVAIAIRQLRDEGAIRRALVVDLDVHQGNGTAAIFASDPEVFTFSMHGEKNFPARKAVSDLDIGLPCGTGDEAYLARLKAELPAVLAAARADCVFYLAGVDPADGDRYGRMCLSDSGLAARDRYVCERVRESGAPFVLLLSGGYAETPTRTAELHAIAYRMAIEVFECAPRAGNRATSAAAHARS
jgi:acetoin utilization deacetylase AcuC-like enzyme